MWVRHHLRPGEFWNLPAGEQVFLLASTEIEMETLRSLERKAEVTRRRR
jgi:hypothetical protein